MKELLYAVIIVGTILALIYVPLAFIWSINTVFPTLAIPFTFKTWAASWFIMAILSSPRYSYSK